MKIEADRISRLNDRPERDGSFVLYWMQASQRERYNHALEYAMSRANSLGLPVLACFCLTGDFPGAEAGHYVFMLEGLRETAESLRDRGVTMLLRVAPPEKGIEPLASAAAVLVTDMGYTRVQRRWRRLVASRVPCAAVQVESDVVVPVRAASDKEEYAAATIRPKITRQLEGRWAGFRRSKPATGLMSAGTLERAAKLGAGRSPGGRFFDMHNLSRKAGTVLPLERVPDSKVLDEAGVRGEGYPARAFTGGAREAARRLERFLAGGLDRYGSESNDPLAEACSLLSPYIHFGQISTMEIASRVRKAGGPGAGPFLEQLIVRRELAVNFVYYDEGYDSFDCLPRWAQETLGEHRRDRREYLYSPDELEGAATHDPYWNAAQRQMVLTGHMHGYMRMYWGKKIIEWSRHPEEAFETALWLNNRYELDGRDPNGFAGVAWCFGKHDRPWKERPVFGKTRYMNASGLRRKFDADGYVEMVRRLA